MGWMMALFSAWEVPKTRWPEGTSIHRFEMVKGGRSSRISLRKMARLGVARGVLRSEPPLFTERGLKVSA